MRICFHLPPQDAEVERVKREEKEEARREQEIEDWELHQRGGGYRNRCEIYLLLFHIYFPGRQRRWTRRGRRWSSRPGSRARRGEKSRIPSTPDSS